MEEKIEQKYNCQNENEKDVKLTRCRKEIQRPKQKD